MRVAGPAVGLVGMTTVGVMFIAGCAGGEGGATMTSDPQVSYLRLADEEGEDIFTLPDIEVDLPVEIDDAGVLSYAPAELDASPILDELGDEGQALVMEVVIQGYGDSVEVEALGEEASVPLPVTLQLNNVEGYDDLPEDCEIGPVDATFIVESYDPETGDMALSSEGVDVPEVTTCGSWNEPINGRLGLPTTGSSSISASLLDSDGDPVELATAG